MIFVGVRFGTLSWPCHQETFWWDRQFLDCRCFQIFWQVIACLISALRSKVTYSLGTKFQDSEHYLDLFYEYVRHCSEEFYNSDEYYAANGVLARSFGYGKTKLLLELENHLPLLPLCIRHSKEPGQSGRTRKVHRVERQVPRRDWRWSIEVLRALYF